MSFLPINHQEMENKGWDSVDFVFVSGDAYVDHPSFAVALITRVLEHEGYRVGILAQPDVRSQKAFTEFGRPNLGFLVCSGNMDSMVNHYTVAKIRRKSDAYSPAGKAGLRPDRADIVYTKILKELYPEVPVLLGGIEASLRRLAHYDYWSDSLRPSILIESGADLLFYGMGERAIRKVASLLNEGLPVSSITDIPGTAYVTDYIEGLSAVRLPSYEKDLADKATYARSFATQYENTDPFTAKVLLEGYDGGRFVVQNPPSMPLSTPELDEVYDLPYERAWHPVYDKQGGIPALEEVLFSITSSRGCFGSCSFCSLTFHQGRIVTARSHESILKEAASFTKDKRFKGYIHDVGGPTANFRRAACDKQLKVGACKNRQCLFPEPCPNLKVDHSDYVELLQKLRELPGVKKVFIRSGIRFDYLLADKDDTFFQELVVHHISGQLKVAPEHISGTVLQYMGKPRHGVYEAFLQKYNRLNDRYGLQQFVVPYLMSSHPGCSLKEAVALAEYLRDTGHKPEQVQDFYPTPSTLSTCMYYTGLDPRTMKEVYVPKSPKEKAMQRALIQFKDENNYNKVHEALVLAGRKDLIGFDKKCLIKPRGEERERMLQQKKYEKAKTSGYAKAGGKKDRSSAKTHKKSNSTRRSAK